MYFFLVADLAAHAIAGLTYLIVGNAVGAGSMSGRDAGSVVLLVVLLVLVSTAIYIGSFIAQLVWLSRSVDNSWYLLGGTPEWSPGWSIGWWFIPGANLVMPLLIILDLNKRMARGVGDTKTWLVITWWVIRNGLPILVYTIGYGMLMSQFAFADPERLSSDETARAIGQGFGQLFGFVELANVIPAALGLIVYRRMQWHVQQREPHALPPLPPPMPPMWWPPPGAPPPPASPPGAVTRG